MAFAACEAAPPAEPDAVDDDAVCCGGTAERCSSAYASCVTNVARNRKQQIVIERFMRTRFSIETLSGSRPVGKLIRLQSAERIARLPSFADLSACIKKPPLYNPNVCPLCSEVFMGRGACSRCAMEFNPTASPQLQCRNRKVVDHVYPTELASRLFCSYS